MRITTKRDIQRFFNNLGYKKVKIKEKFDHQTVVVTVVGNKKISESNKIKFMRGAFIGSPTYIIKVVIPIIRIPIQKIKVKA